MAILLNAESKLILPYPYGTSNTKIQRRNESGMTMTIDNPRNLPMEIAVRVGTKRPPTGDTILILLALFFMAASLNCSLTGIILAIGIGSAYFYTGKNIVWYREVDTIMLGDEAELRKYPEA